MKYQDFVFKTQCWTFLIADRHGDTAGYACYYKLYIYCMLCCHHVQ